MCVALRPEIILKFDCETLSLEIPQGDQAQGIAVRDILSGTKDLKQKKGSRTPCPSKCSPVLIAARPSPSRNPSKHFTQKRVSALRAVVALVAMRQRLLATKAAGAVAVALVAAVPAKCTMRPARAVAP